MEKLKIVGMGHRVDNSAIKHTLCLFCNRDPTGDEIEFLHYVIRELLARAPEDFDWSKHPIIGARIAILRTAEEIMDKGMMPRFTRDDGESAPRKPKPKPKSKSKSNSR